MVLFTTVGLSSLLDYSLNMFGFNFVIILRARTLNIVEQNYYLNLFKVASSLMFMVGSFY